MSLTLSCFFSFFLSASVCVCVWSDTRLVFQVKLCGACCLVCAVVCVVITVTTTVVHMNRLQTLRECVYNARGRSCTCFTGSSSGVGVAVNGQQPAGISSIIDPAHDQGNIYTVDTNKDVQKRKRERRKVLDRSSALTRISAFKVAGREKSRLLYPSQQFLLFISPLYSFFSLVVICIISQCVRVHNKNENENYTTTANRRLTKKKSTKLNNTIGSAKYIFADTPDCEVVHGALYACLRALFGLSVIGILVSLFSGMLVYQLLG